MAEELRVQLRLQCVRNANASAAILDRRTLQSAPQSGGRAGYDGAKQRKSSKVRAAVGDSTPNQEIIFES